MNTYIRKQHKGYYLETIDYIDSEYWAGQIGNTYEDFLNGKWILLSAEQDNFHKENPSATIEEVLNCRLNPEPERTLEIAKEEKIREIEEYDNSEEVNSFTISIDGNDITAWITPEQRSNYKNSLDSAELLGLEVVHPIFNGVQLTLTVQDAKTALALIQIYADKCYIATETHKSNVKALNSIEAVDSYNNMTEYPEKLIFSISNL